MKKLTLTFLFFLVFGSFQFAFAGMSAKDIVKKVQKKYEKDVTDLQANFSQKIIWKLSGYTQEGKGKMLVKGNKFRFETENQTVSCDGQSLWTYNVASKQVLVDKANQSKGVLLPQELLFKFPDNYTLFLLGEEMQNTKKLHLLKLVAKSQSENLQEIKVWVEDKEWLTQKIEYVDLNENVTTYVLSEIKINSKLADTVFVLEAPKGVEVIDLRSED
ncbi:outer membrane lipoprotein carrier protein LolA [bacterium]|nr:outer membrane lipoprotein carrier protein LolA [bacterium]